MYDWLGECERKEEKEGETRITAAVVWLGVVFFNPH